jgi:hypothetical protein
MRSRACSRPALQKTLGQQVVVDNPAGASGTIGTARVARSAPDGYTLLMIHVSHATNLAMYKDLPYHPVNDFEPIGSATSGPMVVVARNGFPAKDLEEFVAYLRANGPKVSLAHAGIGSASHLCALMLMNALGVKLNEIPYKGTGPALNDVMGGQVDVLCDQTSGTVPSVKAGPHQGLRGRRQGAPGFAAGGARAVGSWGAGLRHQHLLRPLRAQGHPRSRCWSSSRPPAEGGGRSGGARPAGRAWAWRR